MKKATEAQLLRIFVGELDKVGGTPLYEKLVYEAKKAGLAGATVLKGVMSFGANSRIHKSKLLDISEDLPMVVEIVDEREKLKPFLETVDDLFQKSDSGGLITLERAHIWHYGASENGGT